MGMVLPLAQASSLVAPYSNDYVLYNLGSLGAPLGGNLGGIDFLNNNTLLVSAYAGTAGGTIYEIGVTRDPVTQQVTGFSGPATVFATAPDIDGGLAFGPGGVLFYTEFPDDKLGEIKPGSTSPDKIIDLNADGVNGSTGSLQFAPNGDLKILSYMSSDFYTGALTPDGSGTYNLTTLTQNTILNGGPEGLFYVPNGSPDFASPSVLVAEQSAGSVVAYTVDGNGNPDPASASDFLTGLNGVEGATIDPVTKDFLFSTAISSGANGASGQIDVVSGFGDPLVPEPNQFLPVMGMLAMAAGVTIRRRLCR
jgi:hypothetical protein